MTNLGPLPTDFALAADCANELDDVYKILTQSPGWYYLLQGPVEQTSCYPSGYAAQSKQFYSPALCPTGFTAACQSLNRVGTVEETVVTCCPTQSVFTCNTAISYTWEETLGCRNTQDSSKIVTWTVSQVSDNQASLITYTNFAGGVNAYSLQVRHQFTDFASSTSTASSSFSSALSSSSSTKAEASSQLRYTKYATSSTDTQAFSATYATSASTINEANRNGSSSSGVPNSGFTPGAAAGITAGAFAGVIILVALVWLQVRHRLRRKQQAQQQGHQYYDPQRLIRPLVVYEMATDENSTNRWK